MQAVHRDRSAGGAETAEQEALTWATTTSFELLATRNVPESVKLRPKALCALQGTRQRDVLVYMLNETGGYQPDCFEERGM